jgi:hypothetical protein
MVRPWKGEDGMSAKASFPGVLLLSILGACLAWGQESSSAKGEAAAPLLPPLQENKVAPLSLPLLPGKPMDASVPASDHKGEPTAQASPLSTPMQFTPSRNAREANPTTMAPIGSDMPSAKTETYGNPGPGVGGNLSGPVPPPGNGQIAPPGLSSWITYTRPDCCPPVGGDGPVKIELYAATGPTISFGDGILAHLVDTGWDVQGGGRSVFFTPDLNAAWVADLSLNYIYNHVSNSQTIPLALATPPDVTAKALHRTFANLMLGREWYLGGPADSCGWHWRVGGDAGGRIGTARLDFVEVRHTTDTIYGVVLGLHSDVEKPWGCCTFLAGVRAEWDFTWQQNLLHGENANVQDVNLLLTVGVRY